MMDNAALYNIGIEFNTMKVYRTTRNSVSVYQGRSRYPN